METFIISFIKMGNGKMGMSTKVKKSFTRHSNKSLNKRGQVTVFIIIGVLLIIVVALLFWLRDDSGFRIPLFADASDHASAIERDISRCIDSNLEPTVNLLASQGGEFNPSSYRLYKGKKVGYVCREAVEEKGCVNYMPTKDSIRKELQKALEFSVLGCFDDGLLEGSDSILVEAGDIRIEVSFEGSNVRVAVVPDITVTKSGNTVSVRRVVRTVSFPLGELYDVAYDIVSDLSRYGEFEQLFYMLDRRGNYIIDVDKPYPDTVYIINKKDSDDKFYIAIRGVE